MKFLRIKAFTLVEVMAVIAILAVLIGITLARIGKTRAEALQVKLDISALEISKAVELLTANGLDTKALLKSDLAACKLVTNNSSDPRYGNLPTKTYIISSPDRLNTSTLNDVIGKLNAQLAANPGVGMNQLKGGFASGEISHYNVYAIEAAGGGFFLKFVPAL